MQDSKTATVTLKLAMAAARRIEMNLADAVHHFL